MPQWRIYYTDGRTFDDTMGEPWEAPKVGVQVINIREGRLGRRTLKLADYYVWSPLVGRWLDIEHPTGVIQRMAREPWAVLLCGEYIAEADFERILIAAHDDPDFPMRKDAPPPHPAWRA